MGVAVYSREVGCLISHSSARLKRLGEFPRLASKRVPLRLPVVVARHSMSRFAMWLERIRSWWRRWRTGLSSGEFDQVEDRFLREFGEFGKASRQLPVGQFASLHFGEHGPIVMVQTAERRISPILRWASGKSWAQVRAYFERKRYEIVALTNPDVDVVP